MRFVHYTAALLVLSLASSSLAQASQTLTVSAHMDIWRAGSYNDGSDGAAPAVYSFSAAAGQALSFSSVTGAWACAYATGQYGPDGTSGPCDNPNAAQNINNPVGPFSGLETTDFDGELVGMFLGDTLPTTAPPPLRFYVTNASQGGAPTDFDSISPQIGQVFFIGDGRTGTGSGGVQVFNVPPTATHLYLGYVDSCNATVPSCYSDNTGSVTATFTLNSCTVQVPAVFPQQQLADREWATQAAIMWSHKTGQQIHAAEAAAIADSVAPPTTVYATTYANGGVSGCAQLDECSISLADYIGLLGRLGITQAGASQTVCGLAAHLRQFGPMTVIAGTPTPNFVNALVLSGVTGDGTTAGSAVNIINPATGGITSVSLNDLLLALEPAIAAGWPELVQFP